MKILFDQGVPLPLLRYLAEHDVSTAYRQGWSTLSNGDLLKRAEDAGYQLFMTTDQNLSYQQNLLDRRIAIVVLLSTSWPKIHLRIAEIADVVNAITSNEYIEVSI